MKKLSREEAQELADALQAAKERDDGMSWSAGSHYVLMKTLRRLGFSAKNSRQAEEVALRALTEG